MFDLVTIREYENANQAHTAALVLQQLDIDYHLANETVIAMDWFLSNAVGGIRLQVPSNQVAQAIAALEEVEARGKSEEKEEDWIVFPCSRCKKPVAISAIHRGRLESCPLCNAYLDVPLTNSPEYTSEEIDATIAHHRSRKDSKASSEWPLAMLILEISLIFILLLPECFVAWAAWAHQAQEGIRVFDWSDIASYLWARSSVFGICIAAVVLFSNTKWSEIGLTFHRWKQDILFGVGLAVGLLLLDGTLVMPVSEWVALKIGWTEVSTVEVAHWPSAEWSLEYGSFLGLVFSALVANSILEECMMRGFLLTRFERLAIPKWIGIFASSTVFAFYHLYLGLGGAACAWVTGLVFGIWFMRTRRLLAPIVAHTLVNIASISSSLSL